MTKEYTPLELKTVQEIGQLYPGGKPLGFSTSAKVDLFPTIVFFFSTFIMIAGLVTAGEIAWAGWERLQASDASIKKSREDAWRAIRGFVGIVSIGVLLYTFNRDMMRGDLGLERLKISARAGSGGISQVVPMTSTPSSNTASKSCDTPQNISTQLSSQGGICGSASCSALAGCTYQQYLTTIQSEASKQGVDPRLVVAILCTESKGKITQDGNKNPNGTYDCGLMQINQNTPCTSAALDPTANIAAGVSHIKQIIDANKQVYANIPKEAGYAAAYNSGAAYNKPSVDCTPQAGFPFTPPKWACPINPGDSQYNMCTVKNYACGVSACVEQLRTQGL